MKTRYRLITRGARGGAFYCVDSLTGQRFSLKTANRNSTSASPRRTCQLRIRRRRSGLGGRDARWMLPAQILRGVLMTGALYPFLNTLQWWSFTMRFLASPMKLAHHRCNQSLAPAALPQPLGAQL